MISLRLACFSAAAIACFAASNEPNSQPNPYRTIENYFQLPAGRTWGSAGGIGIDSHENIWVAERCGANSCAGSQLDPILEFDPSGKLIRSFGAGLIVFPHGLYVDKHDHVWICDGQGENGKGQQVWEFSPEGKVLMTLGKAGVAGDGPDTFNKPSDVIVAPNGDIFVSDGHDAKSNARIVKFNKDGKFIKAWGKLGSGPGEFNVPHCLALDSKGRLLVCDRANDRIQVFDQNGKFIEQLTQFGRPSGIFIDKHDTIYVADSESAPTNHPGWKRGMRIGNLRTGEVIAFIPDPENGTKNTTAAETVVVDSKGAIYGAEVGPKDVKKYVRN